MCLSTAIESEALSAAIVEATTRLMVLDWNSTILHGVDSVLILESVMAVLQIRAFALAQLSIAHEDSCCCKCHPLLHVELNIPPPFAGSPENVSNIRRSFSGAERERARSRAKIMSSKKWRGKKFEVVQ